ncbi:MAG: DUF4140 domain-containing protein, partial [Archangium sp.]|nr:DUF4140 domain-containing protein [Archangium sp.]
MNALILLSLLGSTTAVDRVVVFPDRAQVTRATQVQCGARVPVTFADVPPAAAQDSFRARVIGGTIDGMRAEFVSREKEFSPKVEALVKQLEALTQELEGLSDQLDRAQTQARMGKQFSEIAVQQVSKELAADAPNPKAWGAAFDSSLASGVAAARQVSELSAKVRDARTREEGLRRDLEELRYAQA